MFNGLESYKKNAFIKEILRRYRLDAIMLLETKKSEINKQGLFSLRGTRNIDWVFSLLKDHRWHDDWLEKGLVRGATN